MNASKQPNQKGASAPIQSAIGPVIPVAATALGVAIYGVAHAGMDEFYGALGLTAEQAGYNHQSTIVGVAAALIAIAASLLAASVTVHVLAFKVVEAFYRPASRRLWGVSILIVLAPLVMPVGVGFLPIARWVRLVLSGWSSSSPYSCLHTFTGPASRIGPAAALRD